MSDEKFASEFELRKELAQLRMNDPDPAHAANALSERRQKYLEDPDKDVDLNEDPDYEGNAEHELNGEGRGAGASELTVEQEYEKLRSGRPSPADGNWSMWRNPGEPLVVGWLPWRDDYQRGPAIAMPNVLVAQMVKSVLNAANVFPFQRQEKR